MARRREVVGHVDWTEPFSKFAEMRIHAGRAAGRHRNHRAAYRDSPAVAPQGAGDRDPDGVRVELATDSFRGGDVCQREPRLAPAAVRGAETRVDGCGYRAGVEGEYVGGRDSNRPGAVHRETDFRLPGR